MRVSLVTKTMGVADFENKSIDEIVVAQARVSSSKSKEAIFDKPEKLIRYMLLNSHFSPFQMANLGFNIETSRAISLEIMRHWTIKDNEVFPQQHSLRYSEVLDFEKIELRKQSVDNRQSSTEPFDDYELDAIVENATKYSQALYTTLIDRNVARECARFVLTENARTKFYLNTTLRSWIVFLNSRLHKTAQKEVRVIAEEIRDIFIEQCPIISEALFNFDNAYNIHILDRLVLEKYGVYKSDMSD